MLSAMAEFGTVRVAAIQATPVILDAEATVDKAIGLLADAAGQGAQLAVLPETFVPLYPSGAWAGAAARFDGFDELWERLWQNSVDVPGPLTDRLAAACAEHGIVCAIGVNEREAQRPGSLYNTLLVLGPDGLLSRHRKLMPTHHERLFHGIGSGDDLDAVETGFGRVGGLICWENRMPLARYGVYRSGPQIWLAPTADDSDGWLATIRHIAIESGAYVVSVPQYIPRSAFPRTSPRSSGTRKCSGAAEPRSPNPSGASCSRGPSTTRRGSSRPTATSTQPYTPSAGSTWPATTAARTCCSARTKRGRLHAGSRARAPGCDAR